MDTPRTIGEVPGRSGSVDHRRPASDRLNRATDELRPRIIVMAMPIVRPAQASRSYISLMLRDGMLVGLVGVCLGTVAAHVQNASWLPPAFAVTLAVRATIAAPKPNVHLRQR